MAIQCIKNHYYLSLGHSLNATGKRVPKKVYLGADYDVAQRKATALEAAWKNENTIDAATGLKVWGKGTIENAIAWAVGIEIKSVKVTPMKPKPVQVVPDKPYVPPPDSFTLRAAFLDFAKWYRERPRISESWRRVPGEVLNSIMAQLKPELLDTPMERVGMAEIEQLVGFVKSRPLSRRNSKTPAKISMATVESWLTVLDLAFDHFADDDKYHWTRPNKCSHKTFNLTSSDRHAMMTPLEAKYADKPAECYSIEEVAGIFRRSSPLGKKYILLGVCCAMGQEAIASLLKVDFVRDAAGEFYIEHKRHKTGIEGSWWIPPELGAILTESIAMTPANPDGLAFLSDSGKPLVHGKTDSIKLTWQLCIGPKAQKKLPFGRLRKLSAQLIENISGSHDLAQLQLSHSLSTVASRHYVGRDVVVGVGKSPVERLYDAQRLLWQQIRPLFYPPVAVKVAA